jgi:hypothetical protein
MLLYKRNLKVTQESFDNQQDEIKNAIRSLVDKYRMDFADNFPETRVEFVDSMKGNLATEYNFKFINMGESTESVFAQLQVTIEIVTEEELTKKEENHYRYY